MPDLTQYLWLVWLGFILVCVIIELLTLEFTFLMIAAGSLGGLGANLLGAPWWLQILVALVLSVLLLVLIRPVLLRLTRKGADPTPTNIAALYGMSGRVVLALGETGGQVKLANGETWTAQLDESAEAQLVEVGAPVTVTAIRGSTAIVVPRGRTTS
ncbi:NfeD family protein [Naasia sp. SYSU D00948]|uniref:NfeD family protein n=1 Tax=Naasia sp. SYSU D00948 TaxID=2817379 RepID=UPI001B312F60|nr:NfeD family protein [Naasia sp. SYSU D00948]